MRRGLTTNPSRDRQLGRLGEAVLYWHSDDGLVGPDLQIVLIYAPFCNPWQRASTNAYTFAVALMRPTSRGRLTLASSDPRQPPLIDRNDLGEPHDLEMLVQGIQIAPTYVRSRRFPTGGAVT